MASHQLYHKVITEKSQTTGARDVAQLVECLHSTYKALGSISNTISCALFLSFFPLSLCLTVCLSLSLPFPQLPSK